MTSDNENLTDNTDHIICGKNKSIFLPVFFLSLCLLLLITQHLLLDHRMAYEIDKYPTSEATFANLKKACDPAQTVILGDSASLEGIDPRLLGPSVLNASFGGMSPVEIYLVVKNLWHCTTYPKKVVLSFMPHHYFLDNGYWLMQDRIASSADKWNLRLESYRLHDPNIYNIWPISSPVTPLPGTTPPDKISEFLEELQFPTMYIANFKRFTSTQQGEKNRRTFQFMTQESQGYYTRGERISRDIDIDRIDTNRQFMISPLIDEYFDKLLMLLSDRGIQIYYLPMPVSEKTYSRLRESFRDDYISYITEKSRRFDIKLIGNFFVPYPNEYFYDDSHLANGGAQTWTRQIAPLMPR